MLDEKSASYWTLSLFLPPNRLSPTPFSRKKLLSSF